MLKLKILGSNIYEVSDDLKTVLFSYSTPVALQVIGEGYFVTDTYHSPTTCRHINAFVGRASRRVIFQEDLDNMTFANPSGWQDRTTGGK